MERDGPSSNQAGEAERTNRFRFLADAELDAVAGGNATSTSTNKVAGGSVRPNDTELPPDPVISAGETVLKVAGGALWSLLL
jgi:hypothetical protein